jgi:hypothetical protein
VLVRWQVADDEAFARIARLGYGAALGCLQRARRGREAPLWFYILKEAELPPHNAERLGAVGGRIVAARASARCHGRSVHLRRRARQPR